MNALSYLPDVFVQGKELDLTVLTVEDVSQSAWYQWLNDEQTTQAMGHHYFPNTKESQMAFLETLNRSRDRLQLGIWPKGSQSIIGVVSLQKIDFINRNAELAILVGQSEYRGKGMGYGAAKMIVTHGFSYLNLHRISAGTPVFNEGMIKLAQRLGMRQEGISRQVFYKRNQYFDVYEFGVLKEEFLQNGLKKVQGC